MTTFESTGKRRNDLLDRKLFTLLTVMHIDFTIEDDKHFFAIIDMPFVGLVGPMQAGRNAEQNKKVSAFL